MNNPDERTAVDQFGKGDKYFGVATLMATMPGLPMFGHGQIEGYAESYGMEYRRAYHDETPDQELVARHEREIFPLLHQRWLFAEVDNFALYDFVSADGIGQRGRLRLLQRARRPALARSSIHNRFAETSGLDPHGGRHRLVAGARTWACAAAPTIGWSCATRARASSTCARSASLPSTACS